MSEVSELLADHGNARIGDDLCLLTIQCCLERGDNVRSMCLILPISHRISKRLNGLFLLGPTHSRMRHLIPLCIHQVPTDHLPTTSRYYAGRDRLKAHTNINKLIDDLLHIVLIPYHSGNG